MDCNWGDWCHQKLVICFGMSMKFFSNCSGKLIYLLGLRVNEILIYFG
jgi:hypothetical protein